MTDDRVRISAIQNILASIFASQKTLKTLAPEFNWSGLGNLLGDFGELIAIDAYKLTKAYSLTLRDDFLSFLNLWCLI